MQVFGLADLAFAGAVIGVALSYICDKYCMAKEKNSKSVGKHQSRANAEVFFCNEVISSSKFKILIKNLKPLKKKVKDNYPRAILIGDNEEDLNQFYDNINVANPPFDFVKAPVILSKNMPIESFNTLYNELTREPINVVFIMVDFHSRFDTLFFNFYDLQKIISELEDNIVTIVTFKDTNAMNEENERGIRDKWEEFSEESPRRIIFHDMGSDARATLSQMSGFVEAMKPSEFYIDKEDFELRFNLEKRK